MVVFWFPGSLLSFARAGLLQVVQVNYVNEFTVVGLTA